MKRLISSVAAVVVATVIAACGDAPAEPKAIDPAASAPSFDVAATSLTSEQACRIILTGGEGTISDPARINSLCASVLFRRTLCFVALTAYQSPEGTPVRIVLPLIESGRFVTYVFTATRNADGTVTVTVTKNGVPRYNAIVDKTLIDAVCSST